MQILLTNEFMIKNHKMALSIKNPQGQIGNKCSTEAHAELYTPIRMRANESQDLKEKFR